MTIKKLKETMRAKANSPEAMQELRDMIYDMWSYGLMKGSA